MNWIFESNQPIYLQLISIFKTAILSGEYPAGSKLPSIRDLSVEAGANPNTIQRALNELEREGLISTQRTNGKSVTDDVEKIHQLRESYCVDAATDYIVQMEKLGLSDEEIRELFEAAMKKREESSHERI